MSGGTWTEYDRYPSRDGTHMIRLYERHDYTGRRYTKNERVRIKTGDAATAPREQSSGPQEEQVSPSSEYDPLEGVL